MAPALSRNQRVFASTLAQRTGLDPRLVAAWLVAEEPAGARAPVGHAGDQDWLNIGKTDTKWFGGNGGVFSNNPAVAAEASADWLQGKVAVPGFGRAASGIVAFSRTAGQPLAKQVAALQRSGWASSGYPDLPSLVKQMSGASLPPAAPAQVAPRLTARSQGLVDRQAFDEAQRRYALGQILANQPRSPFDVGPRASIDARNPLLAILPSTPPNAADFARTVLERVTQPRPPTPVPGAVGRVIFAPGADRAGVPTQPIVRHFAGLISAAVGHPITVGTGSNHLQFTVDGNVSDHWSGHAVDIPVPYRSAQGDMIAGRALMLLGVPRLQARAMAQHGGLYTITPRTGPLADHRVQVIWKTQQGGDHERHVHVGVQ